MDDWLPRACDHFASWLEFQMRLSRQPGCITVVMQRGQIALERAFGSADLAAGEPLTPRHRFRIASHSKSFTAAGVMKLREAAKLRLDDPIGQYVKGLHPQIAEATVSQLLSHSAGIVRDGADAGYFEDRRPFPSTDELLADLQEPPVIERNTRHKYSNHGFVRSSRPPVWRRQNRTCRSRTACDLRAVIRVNCFWKSAWSFPATMLSMLSHPPAALSV